MAILSEDYPKLRNLTDKTQEVLLVNYMISILNIKVKTDEEKEDLDRNMIVILDFIKSKFSFLTLEEIREAFKMYVAKQFGHKEIFRNLDTITVSDILNCFINYRADSLRTYNQKIQSQKLLNAKQISEEEKEKIAIDGINRKYHEFLISGSVSDPSFWIFDELVEKGLIKLGSEKTPNLIKYYEEKTEQARKELEIEYKTKTSTDRRERNKIKEVLSEIITDKSVLIPLRVKKIVLTEYFEKQKSEKAEKII